MKKFVSKIVSKARAFTMAASAAMISLSTKAAAAGWDNVTITQPDANVDPFQKMGSVVGILLTLMRLGGVVLVVFGIYDIVMGMIGEGQPEKKTKGFLFTGGGLVLVFLKSVLKGFGVIG